jgi:hypothetical protein
MGDNIKDTHGTDSKRHGKPRFKNGKKQQGKPVQTQSLNSDAVVPMLRFGVANNFDLFKRKVSITCQEKYNNLGQLIMDEQYYIPPAVDMALYDSTNDPHDIEKGRLREAQKRRDKEIDDMHIDRTSMYAYLISKLSKESQDKIQGHADWEDIEKTRDLLKLWIVIKKCHQILTTSKVAAIIKTTAQEEDAACKQGPFEHIMDYKRWFDAKLDALKASGNVVASEADIAMDFMYGLDNARYAEFKAEVINNMQKGSIVCLDDLNKMYMVTSRQVVVKMARKVVVQHLQQWTRYHERVKIPRQVVIVTMRAPATP